jgi:hypothetical protein
VLIGYSYPANVSKYSPFGLKVIISSPKFDAGEPQKSVHFHLTAVSKAGLEALLETVSEGSFLQLMANIDTNNNTISSGK